MKNRIAIPADQIEISGGQPNFSQSWRGSVTLDLNQVVVKGYVRGLRKGLKNWLPGILGFLLVYTVYVVVVAPQVESTVRGWYPWNQIIYWVLGLALAATAFAVARLIQGRETYRFLIQDLKRVRYTRNQATHAKKSRITVHLFHRHSPDTMDTVICFRPPRSTKTELFLKELESKLPEDCDIGPYPNSSA